MLTVEISNGTSQKISVLGGAAGYNVYSINGYMVSGGYVNEEIEPNDSETIHIQFDDSTLKMHGIEEIYILEIGFRFEDFNKNYQYTGPIKLYTSAYEEKNEYHNTYRDYISSPDFENDFGVECILFQEETLAEGNGVEIASWGIFSNSSGELMLLMEIVNSGEESVYLQGTDFCINGLKVYAGTACFENMNPGTTAICSMNLTSRLDEKIASLFDISEIGDVSFTVQVFDYSMEEIIVPTTLFFPVNNNDTEFSTDGVELYNQNGVRLVYKELYDSESNYDNEIYAMFMIENHSGIDIDLKDESVMVNGEKVSTTFFGDVPNACSSAAELILYSYSFEDYGISSLEDIVTMSIEFELRDTKYNTIDEFVVEVPIE